MMPYQVNSGTSMSYELEDSSLEKQQEVDQNNSERAKLLISYLQKNEGLDSFSSSTSLHSEASSLLNKFDNYPEELLENDELNDWQNIFPGAPVYDNVLVTTDHLKNAKDFQEKNVAVLATKPVLDVSFTILEWFSDPYIHSRFITESDKEKLMEIAFSKESMVVLLQEENKETEDSGN